MFESLAKIEKRRIMWRRVESRTLVMTILMQKFTHTSGVETIIKLYPWGMKEVMSSLFRVALSQQTGFAEQTKRRSPFANIRNV